MDDTTICAIATPPGAGPVAVIRLSGNDALTICESVFTPATPGKKLSGQLSQTVHKGTIGSGQIIIDEALVTIFRAPNSYTGENVVEVLCHGSVYIQQKVLQLFFQNGARPAQPGEFTLRAFMNGKMDLSQAEAVADLIASSSEASHALAIRQMRGGFSEKIRELREQLLEFTSLIELEMDFSEEDIEFADRKGLKILLNEIRMHIEKLIESFNLGNVIKNGIPVAIVGKPNVGKSTLLNVLLQEEKAIVTDIPGTTRDTIEDTIVLEGIMFRFIDTAGIRDKTSDRIERIGIEKTFEKINSSLRVLLMVDPSQPLTETAKLVNLIKTMDTSGKAHDNKIIILINKMDIASRKQYEKFTKKNVRNAGIKEKTILISAKENKNIDRLTDELIKSVQPAGLTSGDIVITNARHHEALTNAHHAIQRVVFGIEHELTTDLLTQDLRQALHFIGEISGEITNDEILKNIFSKFCIGK